MALLYFDVANYGVLSILICCVHFEVAKGLSLLRLVTCAWRQVWWLPFLTRWILRPSLWKSYTWWSGRGDRPLMLGRNLPSYILYVILVLFVSSEDARMLCTRILANGQGQCPFLCTYKVAVFPHLIVWVWCLRGTLRWRLLWPKIEREQCFYGHGSGSIKNSSIHLFCHSILVWSMRCSQMSFDPNLLVEFQKFFGHELTTLIFAKDFNLMLALAFYVGMKSLELSESWALIFQEENPCHPSVISYDGKEVPGIALRGLWARTA